MLRLFRTAFLGKASPVHFFWGSFDLAVTRFSGRAAPLHPGGIPDLPDAVTREAYSHEVSSAGFWPGSDAFPQAAFYSYAYPAPAGFADAPRRARGRALVEARWASGCCPTRASARAADPDADRAALPRIDLSRRRRPGALGPGARLRDRRAAPAAAGRLSARSPGVRARRAEPQRSGVEGRPALARLPMARLLPGAQNAIDNEPDRRRSMAMTRREWIGAVAAAGALPMAGAAWAQAGTLKISHQFPGGTATEGDFRDRLCRRFAADIEKRSNGALKAAVYPGSSLMKTNAQFSAMRKGALDISLYPLSYAGGEVAETNIGLMPALVPSYEVGAQWKTSEVGKLLTKTLDEKGIVVLSWIWQAGGVASRAAPLVQPDDAKGLKVRGGSREMDMMLKAAGASVISLPSNEIYAAMQTGAMDAAMTSSTSFISFKLEEIAKNLTSGRNKAYWFMFEPLLMSKEIFAKLPKAQQDIIMQRRRRAGEVRDRRRAGRRQDRRRRLRQGRRQGLRPRRGDGAQVAGDRPRHGVEGLRRARRDLGRAAEGGAEAARVSDPPAAGCRPRRGAPTRRCSPAARRACRRRRATPARRPASTRRRRARCCRWRARSPRANRVMVGFGMLALLAASLVLTSSVVTRYFFKASTDWQDETAVFLLVGATFLCGAFVQSIRGHVGIEAVVDAALAARRRVPARRRRPALPRLLRPVRVEVVDAAARGLGRQADDLVVVGAAALDPLLADVARHDAARAAARRPRRRQRQPRARRRGGGR